MLPNDHLDDTTSEHDDGLAKALAEFKALADKPLTRAFIAEQAANPNSRRIGDMTSTDNKSARLLWATMTVLIELERLRRGYNETGFNPTVFTPIVTCGNDAYGAAISELLSELQSRVLLAADWLTDGLSDEFLTELLNVIAQITPTLPKDPT